MLIRLKSIKIIYPFIVSLLLIGCGQNSGQENDGGNKKWTQALGTKNLGNTCFANSAHKVLWSGLRQDYSPLIAGGTPLHKSFFSFMAQLTKNLSELESGSFSSTSTHHFFESELNQVFNHFETTRTTSRGSPLIGGGGGSKLRQDQADAGEYLSDLLDLLNFDSFIPSFSFVPAATGIAQPTHSLLRHESHLTSMSPLVNLATDLTHQYGQNGLLGSQGYLTAPHLHLPSFVIVSSFRDHGTNAGISKHINLNFYPTGTLPPAVAGGVVVAMTKTYHFNAVAVHHGGIGGGHWSAYTKEKNGWVVHDDQTVELLSDAEFATRKADIEAHGRVFLYID